MLKSNTAGEKNRSITALCAERSALGALFVDGMIGPAAADLDRIQRAAALAGAVVGTLVDVAADVVVCMLFVHSLFLPKDSFFFGLDFAHRYSAPPGRRIYILKKSE